MKHNGTYYLKFYSLIALGLVIFGYGLFQAEKIIVGPVINITSPLDGATYNTSLIELKGTAKNIRSMSLYDRPLYTDIKGNFSEKLLLSPGYNIIKIVAEDKFGSKTEERVEVILQEHI